MTYQKIFYLKYKKGVPTNVLFEQFPDQVERVSEVALLDLPDDLLRQVLAEEEHFDHLMSLKKRYSKFLPKQVS